VKFLGTAIMISLVNKKIVLGVTGSIATYKAPMLVRELIRRGAEVHCIMTPAAENFVTSMVLSNLSRNPVAMDMFSTDVQNSGAWHIHLARECDAMLIAPCSASTLGKIAHGICDNALVTVATALPENIPLVIAPAMDTNMWINPVTQENCDKLENLLGAYIIPPDDGDLASGLVGPGRFPEIDVVIDYLIKALEEPIINDYELSNIQSEELTESVFQPRRLFKNEYEIERADMNDSLAGRRVLVTAGPTHEKIDDIRYIANYSSGKMGFALADEAYRRGAEVILIAGPVDLVSSSGIKRIDVTSAEEMFEAAVKMNDNIDIAIHAAAVADFTPVNSVIGKIKKTKSGDGMKLELTQTRDILAEFGRSKSDKQVLVGFALESTNEKEYGKEKLINKNCDLMIVNSSSKPQSGFGGDFNTISILEKSGREFDYKPMTKAECAKVIYDKIIDIIE
jgi:phosphopantothenoylcysteine decarboxylase / phosphopantothenate---cysteine ligase